MPENEFRLIALGSSGMAAIPFSRGRVRRWCVKASMEEVTPVGLFVFGLQDGTEGWIFLEVKQNFFHLVGHFNVYKRNDNF